MELPSNRLISLDVLRGLTIAGMIVVNDPGSWAYVYPPLRHADWHGITPTDFVFPFFLFIVGVSVVLAYTRRKASGAPKGEMVQKIFKRSAIIFGLGVFLWLFPGFDFSNVRLPGVLQRIALVFMACSLIFLNSDWKFQAKLGVVLLVGYWLLLAFVPVPIDETIRLALETGEVKSAGGQLKIGELTKLSESFIAANLEPGANLEAWIDRLIVPMRLYQYTWDPEGLLSTLPSIATGITGMMAGHLLLSKKTKEEKAFFLLLAGFVAMSLGNVWDWFFPFNKNLWSSSFVLYTSGLATMTLGATYYLIDVRKWDGKILFPFKVFGANAIAAYVLHGVFARFIGMKIGSGEEAQSLKGIFMDMGMTTGFSGEFTSLCYALLYTAFIYGFVWWMYKRRIFLKV